MKKILKFSLYLLLILILVLVGIAFYAETWVNKNLSSIINSNSERKYDLTFERAKLSIIERRIELKGIAISPAQETQSSHLVGEVKSGVLGDVDIFSLVFKKAAVIGDLGFIQPEFIINHFSDTVNQAYSVHTLQDLFGDILTRGEIKNFYLNNASVSFRENKMETGFLKNLSISVKGLGTDSVLVKQLIPFQFDHLQMTVDSLTYQLKTGQNFHLGKTTFDSKSEKIKFENVVLEYQQSLESASRSLDYQTDLVNVRLDSLVFFGVEANTNFHSDLDVRARKLIVTGLKLTDFRNKAKPRPKNEVKPMFQGMIMRLNFPLKLDTLQIVKGQITYGENVPQKGESWQIHWTNLNGQVFNLTSIPENQSLVSQFEARIQGELKGDGKLDFNLRVPYEREEFFLEVALSNFDMTTLNSTLKPIMNGEITSGHLDRLKMVIHSTETLAKVDMIFDYRDLKVELFNKKGEKKNIFSSSLANLALNHSNLPGEKKYLTPSYALMRNKTRGPFYLIWQSTKEGMMKIVPGGAAKKLLEAKED